jgi:prolyl 4-hydroxylase
MVQHTASVSSTLLHEDPLVSLFFNLVRAEECAELIQLARPNLSPAGVSGDTGRTLSPGRIAESAWFPHNSEAIVNTIVVRIADAVGLALERAEALQVAMYRIGGEYRPHFDAYNLQTERGQLFTKRQGQRLYTALLYLNSVEAGGETFFPRLDVEVKPVGGTLLFFANCLEGSTEVHPKSLHGSRPLLTGEKWIANLWFCERPKS